MKEFVKKVPLRKCVITNTQHPKKELIRIVRDPEGNVSIDLTQKAKGHGVYLSKDVNVIKQAMKKKSLSRYLETEVSDDIYQDLIKLVGDDQNE